jgi:hypothetical protein
MPTNKLEVVAARMSVCGECGDLSGPFEDVACAVERVQRCGCRGGRGRKGEPLWPRYDFKRVVELCRCCAGSLVASGSRWSSFFCDGCRSDVVAWNRAGTSWIPVGRHSLANGIGYSVRSEEAGEVQGESIEAARFARRLNELGARIAYLDRWRVRRVRDVLGNMNGPTSVAAYLAAVRAGPARRDVFAALVSYFEVRPAEVDAAGQVSAKEGREARTSSPRGTEQPASTNVHMKKLEAERRFAQHEAQLRFFDLGDAPNTETEPNPSPDQAPKEKSRIIDQTAETLAAGTTGVGIMDLPAPPGTFKGKP